MLNLRYKARSPLPDQVPYDVPADHRRSSHAQPQARAIAITETQSQWLSGKHLDFCSLALCSFALTLLCHSIANPPNLPGSAGEAQSRTSSSATGRTPINSSFSLFTMKASRPHIRDEEQE